MFTLLGLGATHMPKTQAVCYRMLAPFTRRPQTTIRNSVGLLNPRLGSCSVHQVCAMFTLLGFGATHMPKTQAVCYRMLAPFTRRQETTIRNSVGLLNPRLGSCSVHQVCAMFTLLGFGATHMPKTQAVCCRMLPPFTRRPETTIRNSIGLLNPRLGGCSVHQVCAMFTLLGFGATHMPKTQAVCYRMLAPFTRRQETTIRNSVGLLNPRLGGCPFHQVCAMFTLLGFGATHMPRTQAVCYRMLAPFTRRPETTIRNSVGLWRLSSEPVTKKSLRKRFRSASCKHSCAVYTCKRLVPLAPTSSSFLLLMLKYTSFAPLWRSNMGFHRSYSFFLAATIFSFLREGNIRTTSSSPPRLVSLGYGSIRARVSEILQSGAPG